MILQTLVELITASNCLNCDIEGDLLCEPCIAKLGNKVPSCVRCNRLSSGSAICKSCRIRFKIRGVTVAARYDGAIKELISKLKFERVRSAAKVSARLIVDSLSGRRSHRDGNQADVPRLRGDDGWKFDFVTAVPISPARYRERGYSQAELIAKRVAKELNLPYTAVLGRNNGDHQIGKSRLERFEQVQGAFYATRKIKPGARILLIDDVVTTGATLDECARVICEAGAKSVWGAVVAKH